MTMSSDTQPSKSTEERELIDRARRVLPAGGFGNFAADIIIREGRGGRVWDLSGNEYVDFLLGSGPMFLGHAHPEVVEAVRGQIDRGTTFFANNPAGIELAAAIVDALPCAEQVRFVSSGSEADMYAMRLARAHRGREKILKFEGGYHGMSDYALMSLAPKRLANFPLPVPDSAGIPSHVRDEVIVAPFNDADLARRMIEENADALAGVIVEPFQRLIPPAPGFLDALRETTARLGIPLIFDEVVTGFRFAYGGAQQVYGVTPDLCTLGKIVGGGFPLAAIAGSAEIMAHFDKSIVGEDRFTFQIGTLSGNPVAAIAGLKTLEILRRPGTYERANDTGRAIMAGLEESFARHGIAARIVGHPTLFDAVFTAGPVNDYRDVLAGDAAALSRFNGAMRRHGVLKPESKFYISVAHDSDDVARTLEAIDASAGAVTAGG